MTALNLNDFSKIKKLETKKQFYDKLGKSIFKECLDEFNCECHFTILKFSRLDVYFGKESVGEIKYRTKAYKSYIIEESKVEALEKDFSKQKYYIVVLDKEIYFWSLETIKSISPILSTLPDDLESKVFTTRWIRLLPIEKADYHFYYDREWKFEKQ